MIASAKSDATKLLLENLEDAQTILKLFSTCTVHKMTHLFSSDVFNSPLENLPPAFYLWESAMTEEFSEMTQNMIVSLTNHQTLPPHAHVVAHMSINEG